MEKYFFSDESYSADSKRTAKQIKIARLLCERIIYRDHLNNAMIPYSKKYDSEKFMKIVPCNDGSGMSYCKFTEDKKEMKLYRRCSKHSDYMEKQDKNYLFKWIRKYIDGWWS
jgi:hypothetical protein